MINAILLVLAPDCDQGAVSLRRLFRKRCAYLAISALMAEMGVSLRTLILRALIKSSISSSYYKAAQERPYYDKSTSYSRRLFFPLTLNLKMAALLLLDGHARRQMNRERVFRDRSRPRTTSQIRSYSRTILENFTAARSNCWHSVQGDQRNREF